MGPWTRCAADLYREGKQTQRGRCERCRYHMTTGREMGLCRSVSDAEKEVSINCELKGSEQ